MKSKFNLEKKSFVQEDTPNQLDLNSVEKIYYFENLGNTYGPYDINELLLKIQFDTLVYREGIDWTEAINVLELKYYFKDYIQNTSNNNQIPKPEINLTPTKKSNNLYIIISIFLIACSVWYFFINNKNSTNSIMKTDNDSLNIITNQIELNKSNGTWVVIVGSFKSRDKAMKQLNNLSSRGIEVELLNTNNFEKLTKDYYFLCAGKELNQESAIEISKQIKEKGFDAFAKNGGLQSLEKEKSSNQGSHIYITNITASSTMNSANNTHYFPKNVADSELSTWWSPNSNDKDPWIKINFKESQIVSAIEIHNGSHYLNYPNYGDLYYKNNRITKFEVEYSDGSIITVDLNEIDSIQKIELNPKETNYLKFRIIDFNHGEIWSDFCISHLKAIN